MIKRYSGILIYDDSGDPVFDDDNADLHEYEDGGWININDCIICEQDNMMLGDSIDGMNELNGQMRKQAKMGKHYDVMIILKERAT